MLAISKIIGFENSKTPHNGFKVVLNDINSAFRTCFFLRFRPKIDRFLVVSCDVLKQCEESVTIIDGGCARFARNIYCKIFIILAYSQYRRYKYSSCTPPGCYEICCYLFSEGTLMRPGYRRGIPSGEYVQVWLLCMPLQHSLVHRGACTYHPTPPASSTHEAQIYIMRASYPGGVVAVITGGCGAYPRHRRVPL